MFKNSNCQIDPYPDNVSFLYKKNFIKKCVILCGLELGHRGKNSQFFLSSTHLRS